MPLGTLPEPLFFGRLGELGGDFASGGGGHDGEFHEKIFIIKININELD